MPRKGEKLTYRQTDSQAGTIKNPVKILECFTYLYITSKLLLFGGAIHVTSRFPWGPERDPRNLWDCSDAAAPKKCHSWENRRFLTMTIATSCRNTWKKHFPTMDLVKFEFWANGSSQAFVMGFFVQSWWIGESPRKITNPVDREIHRQKHRWKGERQSFCHVAMQRGGSISTFTDQTSICSQMFPMFLKYLGQIFLFRWPYVAQSLTFGWNRTRLQWHSQWHSQWL